jgi:hypothetical protein
MIRASMPATGSQVSPDTQFVLFSAASFPASSCFVPLHGLLFHAVGKKKRPQHLLPAPAKYGDLIANLYNDAC